MSAPQPTIGPDHPCPKCGGTNPDFHCNRFESVGRVEIVLTPGEPQIKMVGCRYYGSGDAPELSDD